MSSGQKVLKGFAIALAVFIILMICSAILGGISLLCGIIFYDGFNSETYIEEVESGKIVSEDIDRIENLTTNVKLDIDLEITNLEMKRGTTFKVEKMNVQDNLKCRVTGNTLKIEDDGSNWFWNRKESNAIVMITIPEEMKLDKVKISMGIGKLKMTDIETEKLELDGGVGVIELDHITVENTDIDGGAGNLTITNGILKNLDLDCGVGLTKVSGDMKGNSKISCGVGKTEISLTGAKEDYKIRTEKGLGEMTIDGKSCLDGEIYGNGSNYIKIDGGVGRVNITTKQ